MRVHSAIRRRKSGLIGLKFAALLLILSLFSGCSWLTAPAIRYEWLSDQWVEVPGGRYVWDGVDYRFHDGVIPSGVLARWTRN